MMQNCNSDSLKPSRSSTVHGGEDVTESKSALEVAYSVSTSIPRALVGPQEAATLRFHLAACLLATVDVEDERILKNVEAIKEKGHEISDEVEGDPYKAIAGTDFVVPSRDGEINEDYVVEPSLSTSEESAGDSSE